MQSPTRYEEVATSVPEGTAVGGGGAHDPLNISSESSSDTFFTSKSSIFGGGKGCLENYTLGKIIGQGAYATVR